MLKPYQVKDIIEDSLQKLDGVLSDSAEAAGLTTMLATFSSL